MTLDDILKKKPWEQRELLIERVKELESAPKRTPAQNRSLHLWLSLVAEELDKNGHTLQNVVEKIQKAEIRPTKDNLKEVIWKPYQLAALRKESTTELTKAEVDKVYEGLNKFLGDYFHIHIPFPNDELKQLEELGGYKTKAGTSPVDYPEYKKPTI